VEVQFHSFLTFIPGWRLVVRFIARLLHAQEMAPLRPFGNLVGLRTALDAVPKVEIKSHFISLLALVTVLRYPNSYHIFAHVRFHSSVSIINFSSCNI